MSIVVTLLGVLLVALSLLMLLIILMQRPKQEGLGAAFGGGMMDGVLGAGTTNFLQKATVYMTVGYFVVTTTMAVIQARQSPARSTQGRDLEKKESVISAAPEEDAANDTTSTPVPAPAPEDLPIPVEETITDGTEKNEAPGAATEDDGTGNAEDPAPEAEGTTADDPAEGDSGEPDGENPE